MNREGSRLKMILNCITCYVIYSVKPFKSKNRDKIDLDATNPNLKKVLIEIFERQFSSNKILSMKFELKGTFYPINSHNSL